jgi:hypothetical protein
MQSDKRYSKAKMVLAILATSQLASIALKEFIGERPTKVEGGEHQGLV